MRSPAAWATHILDVRWVTTAQTCMPGMAAPMCAGIPVTGTLSCPVTMAGILTTAGWGITVCLQ